MNSTCLSLKISLAIFLLLATAGANGQKKGDEKLLIPVKYLQVTTNTIFQIVSSTVFPFCITGSVGAGALCTGKRRRRSIPVNADITDKNESNVAIDSSKPLDPSDKEVDHVSDREKFFKFTIWNTASFTTSITLLYTNTGSSISLSYYCYAPRMSLPPACG